MNQNNNQSNAVIKDQQPNSGLDQEPMSEDTSLSSSDEGMWIVV